ncbi:hypothetical protein BH11BAC2_BH11BAC2_00940 [soil metagenome]
MNKGIFNLCIRECITDWITVSQREIIKYSVFFLLVLINNGGFSQGVIPTKGKDFWLGFPYNPQFGSFIKRCDIFITSEVNTTGTITIPLQGYSQTFTVLANQTTTVTLPPNIVEHSTSEVKESKGIEIITNDTVSVFAISFQQYTADGTVVYPKQSLGTEYRISSYKGLSNYSPPNLNSDLLIVATEDGTQFNITPTVSTLGGKPAGVPFTVNLNAGQSYQLLSSSYSNDLTGTLIKSTDSSGSCRPFAVFSGSTCVNIPSGCTACDILFDQAIPVPNWGKIYYSVPFAFATSYTIRILADQNSSLVTIDGGAPITLNAGQFTEINNVIGTRCINSNKPISVIQYMQGVSCSGAGDPSMMYLNAQEQKIDKVVFSTVTSTVITQHNVNVIMNTADIGQLKLDGISVASNLFNTVNYCTAVSYVKLSLTQGSHMLEADSGFTAYVYGTGSAESYAYSVGSYSKSSPIQIDSITCSSDTIHLGSQNILFGSWWSESAAPNDTIGIGAVLTLTPPILPGTYIQHGNEFISGCEKNFYYEVEVPDPPQLLISSISDSVCVNQQVQLGVTLTPASSNYLYSWSPAVGLSNPNSANPILTATVSGWYKVAVSSPNGCANTVYDSVYIYVLQLPLPSVNINGAQSICPGDTVTLTTSSNLSYTWFPGGSTDSSIVVSPLITTAYILYVTDSNGCVNSDTLQITVKPIPSANAGLDRAICLGQSTTLSAVGGVSYQWNNGLFTGNTISVSPASTVDYIVEVTGANGCVDFDTVTVTVNPLPLVNAGIDQTICYGDSASLNGNGGGLFYWSPSGLANGTITVSPMLTTNYILRVTDLLGCRNFDTATVFVLPLPIANAGPDRTICLGDTITLYASGGVSFLWNYNATAADSITISPLTTTTYSVTVTDSNLCHRSDSARVFVNPLPLANAGADISFCEGLTSTLTAVPSGLVYLWNPGNFNTSSIQISPIITTDYQLEVIDANGCINFDTVHVEIFPKAIATAGPDQTICSGSSAQLFANGGVSFLWTPSNLTNDSIIVSPGITTDYELKVTDVNGCLATDTVTIYVDPAISGSLNFVSICIGNNIQLTDSGGVNYNWSPGGSNSNSIIVSPTTTTTYIVDFNTPVGCQVIDSTTVIVNPLPLAFAGSDFSICLGDPVNLSASGGVSYLWLNIGDTSSVITLTPSTTMNYSVAVTDINGCVSVDSVRVQVNNLPIANAGNDQTICIGNTATLLASGGAVYLWMPGNNSGAQYSVSPITNTNYTVMVTDTNGCINTDTLLVEVIPSPDVVFSASASACENIPVQLSNLTQGVVVNTYWNFGDGTSSFLNNPSHLFLDDDEYVVNLQVTNDYGCSDSASAIIKINPVPIIDFSTTTVCLGEVTSFKNISEVSSGSILQWFWQLGDGTTETQFEPLHIYPYSGDFDISLTATSDSGCSSTALSPQAVVVRPLPEAGFTSAPNPVSILNPVVHFSDKSSNAIAWQWSFGDGYSGSELRNPQYQYSDTGIFNVQQIVTNQYGCLDTSYNEIYVAPYFTLYIPNAFTPNGDDKNEEFKAKGIGAGDFEMSIFDRWGQLVYHSKNIENSWNGKMENNSEDCQVGVYIYKVNVNDYLHVRHQFEGTLSLIR